MKLKLLLLVVLVVVTAILVTGAWVMAAKRSATTPTTGIKLAPEDMKVQETPATAPSLGKFTNQQNAIPIPGAPAIEKKAAINEQTGRPQKESAHSTSLSGTPVRLGSPGGKDLCNLAGTAAYFITDYIWGLEWYANYQDPAVHGCTAVWPFRVSEIDFQMNFPPEWVTMDVSLQGFVFEDVGTPSCPAPEAIPGFVCSTAVNTYTIPTGGGYFEFPMPMTDTCCIYVPYFAVVYILTDLYGLGVDAVVEGTPATCRSYNDYGSGWGNLNSWPGPIMLYSKGYTEPQNDCPTLGCCVSIAQIDFTWTYATFFDSRTGQVEVDIAALRVATGISSGYLNVLTSTGWVVQNLPVLDGFPYPTISTDFDLGASGDITSLYALIDYSPDPVTSFTGSPTILFPVGTTQFNAQGYFSTVTGGPPVPPPVGVVAFQAGGVIQVCCQPGHANVQTANNQCAPAAVANSFDWLGVAAHPHVPGLGADGSLVGEIETDMARTFRNRADGDPCNGGKVLTGKLTYLATNGIVGLDIKHQSGGNDPTVPDSDFTAAGLTSFQVPGAPSAAWIKQEICNGEDVELGYLNPVPPGGGHFVEVTCAGHVLGVPFIIHRSDQAQTDVDPGDVLGTAGSQFAFLWCNVT